MSKEILTISRSSWHYKLYRYYMNVFDAGPLLPFRGERNEHEPQNLCRYFWVVAGAWAPLLLMTIGIGLVLLIAWPFLALYERRHNRAVRAGKTPKLTLAVAYVTSRKQKVCPRIKVVDPEQGSGTKAFQP